MTNDNTANETMTRTTTNADAEDRFRGRLFFTLTRIAKAESAVADALRELDERLDEQAYLKLNARELFPPTD